MLNNNEATQKESVQIYEFPIGMDFVRRVNIYKYVPICPTFRGWGRSGSIVPSDEPQLDHVI